MKKILSTFLTILLLCSQVFASNMYILYNTDENTVKPFVKDGISKKNYYVIHSDPVRAQDIKNSKEYVTVILQPAGNHLYYFYKSTNNKNSVDKAILKNIRRAGIKYDKAYNTSYLQTFEDIAAKVANHTYVPDQTNSQVNTFTQSTQNTRTYTFDDSTYNQQVQQVPVSYNSNVLKGYVGEVPKGTSFAAYLQTPVNTASAQVGDQITAVLTQDWVYRNNVIAPQGSIVTGSLSKARSATYGSRNGRVVIQFNTITTPEGKTFAIGAEDIDFTVTNDGKFAGAAGSVVGMAIAGAVVGMLFAAIGGNNIGAGAAIGAGSGAAAGALKAGAERGVDAEIPIYTELEITLNKPLNVVLNF